MIDVDAMTADWVRGPADELAVANGRVYIGTYDSILYCFGLPGTK